MHDSLEGQMTLTAREELELREKQEYMSRLGCDGSHARELELTVQAALDITRQIAALPDYVLPDGRVIGPNLEDRINDASKLIAALAQHGGPGSTARARVAYVGAATMPEERRKRQEDVGLVSRSTRWRNPEVAKLRRDNEAILKVVFGDLTFEEADKTSVNMAGGAESHDLELACLNGGGNWWTPADMDPHQAEEVADGNLDGPWTRRALNHPLGLCLPFLPS